MGLEWNVSHLQRVITDAKLAALKETGEAAVNTAKQRVNVDTGNLRDHIDYTIDEATGTIQVGVDGVDYALIEEIGGQNHTAHPYLRPAMDQEAPNLSQRIANHMKGGQ